MRFLYALINLFASICSAKNLGKDLRRFAGLLVLLTSVSPIAAFGATYYLSPSGNDSHNGSYDSPWLSPKHNLNCGDEIIAESGWYYANNFNAGHWGYVYCPSNNNVAWLKCATFDTCKIYSTNEGINVDHSYWGVQGWEVTIASGTNGFCFGAAPSYANWVNIHHIIFANNVANGCQAGGFSTYNLGNSGVDYVVIVGNIAYNAIQGGAECYNAISIYQPVQTDWNSGTHIYIADNFAWGNYQPNYCGGVQAWGGDAIILDTFDGSGSSLPNPYGAQAVVQNNVVLGNGGHGIEVQNNVRGSYHAPIYLTYNTSWGNEAKYNQQTNHLCAEVLLNSVYNTQEHHNLIATKSAYECAGNPMYALSVYNVNGTVWIYSNNAFGYNGQNAFKWAYGSFTYDSNNVLGVDPYLDNAYVPSAPSCGGTGTVANCMGWLTTNFLPTVTSAKSYGHQWPGNYSYDSLFPQWVCNVNIPNDLIKRGC